QLEARSLSGRAIESGAPRPARRPSANWGLMIGWLRSCSCGSSGCRGRCCRVTRSRTASLQRSRTSRSRRRCRARPGYRNERLLVVEKAVLAEEGDVAETEGPAAIKDDRVEGISLIALPYAGAAHPRHAHSDCQIVSKATIAETLSI